MLTEKKPVLEGTLHISYRRYKELLKKERQEIKKNILDEIKHSKDKDNIIIKELIKHLEKKIDV